MADLGNFDATQVEPTKDFELIPDNTWVEAMISESEMKSTTKGGKYLKLVMDIVAGPFKGYHLWENLNLVNANATCVQIAKGKLSSICRAAGVMRVTDSVQLHNLPMMVKVGLEKGDDGVTRNKVKDYKPRQQVGPMMDQAVAAAKPAAPAPTLQQAVGGAPWTR